MGGSSNLLTSQRYNLVERGVHDGGLGAHFTPSAGVALLEVDDGYLLLGALAHDDEAIALQTAAAELHILRRDAEGGRSQLQHEY
jgi:hypothetical protein